MPFTLRFEAKDIPAWLAKYSGDKELLAIGVIANKRGYYTYEQFRTVCDWKTRRRPHKHYDSNTPEQVAVQTYIALHKDTEERERMNALTQMKGVRLPTASMLLQLVYPDRYPPI